MENVGVNRSFWRGKSVFLTGHTGFKGGWLAMWLSDMGASVYGFALKPPTIPNFFTATDIASRLETSNIADIRDSDKLNRAMIAAQPSIVIHFAAQPLVRYSYAAPVETYDVNVMGTVNLFEAVRRHTLKAKAIINVTSDKCYANREWLWPYREDEALGGADPYSSSKACSELITSAYRSSFLQSAGVSIATARAGNVIGGGDWAADRLVPDILRASDAQQSIAIRSPEAIRPWQHVLEPLAGYLTLAEKLYNDGSAFAESWNFGPDHHDTKPVSWIVDYLCDRLTNVAWHYDVSKHLHETNILRLDSSKARARLGWRPCWNLETALARTWEWHQAWKKGANMAEFSLRQIHDYEAEFLRS